LVGRLVRTTNAELGYKIRFLLAQKFKRPRMDKWHIPSCSQGRLEVRGPNQSVPSSILRHSDSSHTPRLGTSPLSDFFSLSPRFPFLCTIRSPSALGWHGGYKEHLSTSGHLVNILRGTFIADVLYWCKRKYCVPWGSRAKLKSLLFYYFRLVKMER
jgi:hypothetical protein